MIYMDENKEEFIIEIENDSIVYQINSSFKRRYNTEKDFINGLLAYKSVMNDYDIIAIRELESIISKIYTDNFVSYR